VFIFRITLKSLNSVLRYIVKTCNIILGMVKRSFTFRSGDMIVTLYKSLIRPQLEYCIQAWSAVATNACSVTRSLKLSNVEPG